MSSPRLRFSRPRALTDGQRARRIVLAALVLINPVTAAIAVALILAGRATRKWVRAPWILTAGIAATAWGVWADQAPAYFHAYRDLASRFIDALAHAGDTAAVIRDNWQAWALDQAPFAACAATLAAGIYLTYRRRFDATWREAAGDGGGDRARRPRKPPSRRAIERAKARQRSRIARTTAAPGIDGLTIPIGVDAARARPVSIDAAALRTHGVVIGPTGVGKTQALERLVHGFTAAPAARALRLPAVVIDMKADPGLATTLRSLARAAGRGFRHVTATPASPDAYNPLAGLTADEAADALYEVLFAADTSLNMHYATLSRRLLQQAARVLADLDAHGVRKPGGGAWRMCLADVTALLSIETLRQVAPYVGPGVAQSLMRYLDDIDASKGAAADVGDIRDRMAVIADTGAGQVLDAAGFRLEDAIRAGDITVFSLDAAGSPATARAIGTLAVQDLSACFGRLARDGWGQDHMCLTVLDEFSALASPKVADLYARARSAGGAVLLATQDLDADLEAVSSQFAAAVRTNANVWLVLRQTRGEAADAIAKGAEEIDMVVNLRLVKEGDVDAVEADIRGVREACRGAVLKVIIESAALTDEEIVSTCRAAEAAGADFVKTSTGFHPAGGASTHAVALMRTTVGDRLGVKASGGIRTAADALAMVEAGANRLGLSASAAVLDGLAQLSSRTRPGTPTP